MRYLNRTPRKLDDILDMSIIKYPDSYGIQLLRIKDRIVQPSRVDHLLTMYLSLQRSVPRLFSN